MLAMSCSRGSNPYQFSKVEKKAVEPAPQVETQVAPRSYTLLEQYLEELISVNDFVAWFFQDQSGYRGRLYDIKSEIKTKVPLSDGDTNRILVLEYRMNRIIREYNERSLFKRAADFRSAVIDSYNNNKKRNKENLAKIISDNPLGFLNSFFKHGYKIEEVDFFSEVDTSY